MNREDRPLGRSETPEKLLLDFDPTPGRRVQEKIDFFFMPYELDYSVAKSMKFGSNKSLENQVVLQGLVRLTNDPYISPEER